VIQINLVYPKSCRWVARRAHLAQLQYRESRLQADLRLAHDPSTSATDLERLAEHESTRVKRSVASNPNTPLALLWELAELFPTLVLDNPILNLLFLETPNLTMIPFPAVLAMARTGNLEYATVLAQIPNLTGHMLFLSDPTTPTWLLDTVYTCWQITRSKHRRMDDLKINGLGFNWWHEHRPTWAMEFGQFQKAYRDYPMLVWLIAHQNVSPKLLEILFKHHQQFRNFQVTSTILQHPRVPIRLVARAMLDLSEDVLKLAWQHRFTATILAFWLENPRHAPKPLTLEQLKWIAETGMLGRAWIAHQPKIPAKVLDLLARAEIPVRAIVASSRNTFLHTRVLLAHDPNPRVVVAAIQHHDLPKSVYVAALELLDLESVLHAMRQPRLTPQVWARLEAYRLALTFGQDWGQDEWRVWLGEVVHPSVS
jgi:hypothetical protein